MSVFISTINDATINGHDTMTDYEITQFINAYKNSDDDARSQIVSEIINNSSNPKIQTIPSRAIILLRYQDRLDEAEAIASHFINVDPFTQYISWELGYSLGVSGEHARAIPYIKHSIEARDTLERRLWLAVQYAMSSTFDAANDVLQSIAPIDGDVATQISIHEEFFDLLKNYAKHDAFDLMRQINSRFAQKSISELESDITQAIESASPYLLLRLGDGEGAHICLNQEDEYNHLKYYRANREEFANIWFKDDSVLDDPRYYEAINLFNDSIAHADAIGGSMYSEAVNLEYAYSSRRGINWVVNTMRKLLLLADSDPEWARRVPVYHLVVHYDLLISGALGRFLKNRKHVGLISCQDRLPDALKRTYNIESTSFIKVPGEQIHSQTLGDQAVAGKHWPDRYFEIMTLLASPQDRHGELWLVAAGMLGKIYAAKLKAAGAVVLDIGAVADLWMGKATRTFPDLPEDVKLNVEEQLFTLVDVGGLGGLGREWQPHIERIRAVLFEPNPPEAAIARQQIAQSPGGIVIERALSNRPENRTLHVTKSLGCTSLLEPNKALLDKYSIAPAFRITHNIEVDCVRFDSLVLNGEAPIPDAIKIDVQGFEYNVLEGFGGTLNECLGVKTEAHLYPIYQGQKLLSDLVELLHRYGLTLRRLEPVNHFDGDIVEVDAWFTCSNDRFATLTLEQKRKLAFLEEIWEIKDRCISFGANQFDD